MSSARSIKKQGEDPTALASIIEINRKAIDEGWEELERLTRLLETLTRQTPRPAPSNDVPTPVTSSVPSNLS
jgi:hypothetical protein